MDNQTNPTQPSFTPPPPPNPMQPQPTAPSPIQSNPIQPQPIRPVPVTPADKPHHRASIIETIILVFVSLLAITFVGLFIWAMVQYQNTKFDVEGQINKAVAVAINDTTEKLESDFTIRQNADTTSFTGPADYGSLTIEYPKLWSVYEEEDKSPTGDYIVYFNPGKVYPDPKNSSTINALRFSILEKSVDKVESSYRKSLEKGTLTFATHAIGNTGDAASVYTGQLNKDVYGKIAIFSLRGRTVTIQTDASIYFDVFDSILNSISYSK